MRTGLVPLLLLTGAGLAETPADVRALVRRSLAGIEETAKKLADYGYVRRVERKEFSGDGAVKTHQSWVNRRETEEGFMVMRLIERDGQPIPEPERLKNEEILRKRLAELKAMTPEQIQRLRDENLRRSREGDEWIQEFPEALDYRSAGEAMVDGRPALVLEASPRKGYRPTNLRARIFEKTRGRLWIDKAEAQLVKADAEVFEAVNIGWGLLGRIEKGTRFLLERRQVAPDVWLPSVQTLRFDARVMLVKSVRNEVTTRYSDYRHRSAP